MLPDPASNMSADMAQTFAELLVSHPKEGFSLAHDPPPGGMNRLVSFQRGDVYVIDVFGRVEVRELNPIRAMRAHLR